MAIYHFSGTLISRSQGRSAVACAAYRSANSLFDETYGRTHNYLHKQDVAFAEILLPEQAKEWMKDREKLWNAVEKAEKRKDAQLAREFNFALPRELSIEQNIKLACEFIKNEFVNMGMIADVCIHNDKMPDGSFQPHAHVMLTLREVTPSGFGHKVRSWNTKENLFRWRESWAMHVNRTFSLHDIGLLIDHRSFKEQGVDLQPQYKIGATIAKRHKANFADHQRIAKENGEKIYSNPNIALDALTRANSTFTHQDLARFINRHTVDAEQFHQVYTKVFESHELVSLGYDDSGCQRLTTREMLQLETKLLEDARQMASRTFHPVKETNQTSTLSFQKELTSEQKTAFKYLTDSQDLACVIGFAGTGKSYLLGAAREAWEAQGYCVLGATLSGIAAENLTGSSGIESRTLASRFYHWDRGEQLLESKDILVIDEAGMVGSRQMARLLDEAHSRGVKVVLVGDPQQLQAIEAGAAFRSICEQVPYVELTDIRRQCHTWQAEATKELASGNVIHAIERYSKQGHVHGFETNQVAKQNLVNLWNDVRLNQPDKTQIMLAYTKIDVEDLNLLARKIRCEHSEIGEDHLVITARGERKFASQDRIYFLKNDRTLGVMNGTLGTVEKVSGQQMIIRLDSEKSSLGERHITVDTSTYNYFDYGYAATIHKAQGVTVDRSYILASSYLDAHATYVGLSRHRESADIFWSREEFTHEQALANHLSRDKRKDVSIDYQRASLEKLPEGYKVPSQSDRAKEPNDVKQFHNERLAVEAEIRLQQLEKALTTSRFPSMAQQKLAKFASKVAKQPEIMNYLKNKNKSLSERIERLAHAFDRSRDRGISR
jgi:Ti-type conjugative transfer relaxase TraA